MNLTEYEKQIARDMLSSGVNKEIVLKTIKDNRIEDSKVIEPKTYREDFKEDIGEIGTNLKETWQDRYSDVSETYDQFKENPNLGTGLLAVGDTALEAGKGAFQSLWNVAGGAVKAVAPQELEDFTKDTFTGAVKSITDNYEISPEFRQAGKNVNEWYTELQKTNPQIARIIEMGGDAGELALEAFGWGAGGKVVKKTGAKIVDEASKLKNSGDDIFKGFFADSTAEKKAYEILQLPTSQTAKYVAKEKTPPAIREFIDNLDELVGSEDYKEVMKRLNTINTKNMTVVDDIISKNNYAIDNKVLNSLKEEIVNIFDNPSIKASAKKAYKEVLDSYEEYFARKGTITRLEAQELKKQLNDSVRTLYDKAEAGTLTVQEKSEQKALDLVRRDIQRAVEGDDAIIRELNAKYTGIKDAVSAISKRDTKAMNTPELTKFQKLAAPAVEFVSSMTGAGSASFVGRRALKTEKSLKKLLRELQEAKKKGAIKDLKKTDTSKAPKQPKDSKVSKAPKKSVNKSYPNNTKAKPKSQYTAVDKKMVKEHNSIVKELKSKESMLAKLLTKKQTATVKKAITQVKKVIKTLKKKLGVVRTKMEKAGLIAKKGEGERGFISGNEKSSLIQEAKKYKTADEFIEAQYKKEKYRDKDNLLLFHSTDADLDGLRLKFGAGKGAKKGGQSGGHFFSDDMEVSNVFGKNKYRTNEFSKNDILDLTTEEAKKEFRYNIGDRYKTYDGELVKFTQQDYNMIFPNGKADFATVAMYPELVEYIAKQSRKKGIAFMEYAGGKEAKTYQLFKDNIPVMPASTIKTSSQLRKIWEEANKK